MVSQAFVLLPLYIYPSNHSWDVVTSTIAANPTLTHQVIVSPNLASEVPDFNYVTGLRSLNALQNVQTLGYVHTSWASRDIDEVKKEIDVYARWPQFTEPVIAVDGIFFDETPSKDSNEAMEYLKNVTIYARKALGPGKAHVTLNPGLPVNESFYKIADTVNIFENAYSAFNLTTLDVLDWDLLAKSTYAIHSFTGDIEEQRDLISNLSDSNVGGFLITTEPGYTALSSLWPEFSHETARYKRNEGEGDEGDDDNDDENNDEEDDCEDENEGVR